MASQYQAIDGKLFDTEQEAAAHNLGIGVKWSVLGFGLGIRNI
jgi:hypothetical protein